MTTSFLKTLAALAVGAFCALNVQAQSWPAKQPIRIVVPYPPGGASDVTARLLSVKLGEAIKQNVIVENKPGANGIIALEEVARSAPDGYTLLMANLGPNAINPTIYKKLSYDPIKDFTPITLISQIPLVVLVNPALPINSIQELLDYAKAHPEKLTFASAGTGAANHMSGEMMQSMADIKMVHVPYRGDAPAMQDVIAGTVSMIMPTLIGGLPQVKSGTLRALAVTSAQRSSAMTSLPTVAESGIPGFDAVSWGGIMGPGGMPEDIVNKLNVEMVKIFKQPDVVEKMNAMGADVVASSPQEFADYLQAEITKWRKVATDNNVHVE